MTIHSGTLPSDRRFGLMLTILSAALGTTGVINSWTHVISIAWFMFGVAIGLITLVAPRSLTPLNRLWFRSGFALGRVVNPVVLGLIFFALLTPVAFLTRTFRRDELRLRR